jgi:hypothetical protein
MFTAGPLDTARNRQYAHGKVPDNARPVAIPQLQVSALVWVVDPHRLPAFSCPVVWVGSALSPGGEVTASLNPEAGG